MTKDHSFGVYVECMEIVPFKVFIIRNSKW